MNRFRASWELFKASVTVMSQNKVLLIFPICTAMLSVCIVLLFIVPVAFQPTGHSYSSAQHWETVFNSVFKLDPNHTSQAAASDDSPRERRTNAITRVRPLAVGYFALMYFITMFSATFCNVVFYREIMNALSGQPVSILDGIRFACTRWKIILMWTLFAGLVGFIIRNLEQRFGIIGEIFMKLIGAVWSIACVFVIPVIVVDEEASNPFIVLKKSVVTLTQTWGESLIAYAGVSVGGAFIILTSLVWLAAWIAMASMLKLSWLILVGFAGWFLGIIVLGYLSSVASQVFRCALFLYASQGNLPAPYTDDMMALAWRTRKR